MYYILIFIIGLLFWSFGSVILHRLGDEITRSKIRSVLFGRSHCPYCKHQLARFDLFPLVSWLATRGKCRYCGTTISHWYPLLELGSGLVFLGVFYWWSLFGAGDLVMLAVFLFLNRSFYLLMVHDIRTMYLHPAAWWFSVVGAAAMLFYHSSLLDLIQAAQWVFVFAVGFSFFYYLAKIYVRWRWKHEAEWIWQGDVMLAPIVWVIMWKIYTLMIHQTTAWLDIIQYFWYYVIAACIAALVLLVITPITKEEGKRMIPFFPGMIVGIWLMMIIWPWLITII